MYWLTRMTKEIFPQPSVLVQGAIMCTDKSLSNKEQ